MMDQRLSTLAFQNGHLKVVRFLVDSGALKDRATTDLTNYEETPLYTAAQKGHLHIVRFLVESGATDDFDMASYAAERYGHFEVVRFLVESGFNKRPRHHR